MSNNIKIAKNALPVRFAKDGGAIGIINAATETILMAVRVAEKEAERLNVHDNTGTILPFGDTSFAADIIRHAKYIRVLLDAHAKYAAEHGHDY